MSKALGKRIRQAVHQKYGGHCAYCGREITMREMQVDHAKPQGSMRQIGWTTGNKPIYEDIHHISNLMPSCRYCNNYKGGNDIEGLRHFIKNLACSHQLMFASYSKGMVLQGLGIIQVHPWDGKFYFEKQQPKQIEHENISEIPYQAQEGEILPDTGQVCQHG